MFFKMFNLNATDKLSSQVNFVEAAITPDHDEVEAARKAEIRRAMYERIAQGHAIEEAEEDARRKWRG